MFSTLDLVIFGLFLALSVVVGFYHAVRASWPSRGGPGAETHTQTADYLSGGRKLPIIPVVLSLLTTFISGINLLALPAEIYLRGFAIGIANMTGPLAFLLIGIYFLPVFYKLKFLNAYEYFEWRFHSQGLRRWGSSIFIFNTLIVMAVVIYAPSVALNGVTEVPLWPLILVVGSVGTLYTTMGGIKAVIWTDTLQSAFLYFGLAVLLIKGTWEAGGFARIVEMNEASGHLSEAMLRFHPTLMQYNSVWLIFVAGTTHYTAIFGLNQMAIQRYCSMPSLRDAKVVMGLTMPAQLMMGVMYTYLGLLLVGYFAGCDPIALGEVHSPDQLTILMAMRVLGGLPGLPGMFLATLFSATLSTISSGMNSMTAVLWEDFLKGVAARRHLTDRECTVAMKVVTVLFGVASTVIAFAGQWFSGMFWIMLVLGAIAGPLTGLFFLGVFFPRANRNGAWIALLVSTVLLVLFASASQLERPYDNYVLLADRQTQLDSAKPFFSTLTKVNGTDPGRCSAMDRSVWENKTDAYLAIKDSEMHFGRADATWMARLSPYSYSPLGVFLMIILGVAASAIFPEKDSTAAKKRLAYACTYWGLDAPIEDGEWKRRLEEEQAARPKLSVIQAQQANARLLMGGVG